MSNPYRDAIPASSERYIDTNDVDITIYYEDLYNGDDSVKREIKTICLRLEDQSYTTKYLGYNNLSELSDTIRNGEYRYSLFIENAKKISGYQIEDKFIPSHRIISIDKEVRSYKKRLEIKVR